MYLLLLLTIACQNEDFKLLPHAQYKYTKSDRHKNVF